MGKQAEGTKEIDKEKRRTEFLKKKNLNIMNGTLNENDLHKLRINCYDTFKNYIDKLYIEKYKKTLDWNKSVCATCIISALFDKCVSDEEVICTTGAKHV